MIWVVLAQAVAFYLAYSYTEGEVVEDHGKILADGSKNSLNYKFHADNAWQMGAVLSGLASCSVLVMLFFGQYADALFLALAHLGLTWAWYGFRFTQGLNLRRGLHRWYVSRQLHAAWTDRTVHSLALRFGKSPEQMNRIIFTSGLVLAGVIYAGVLGWIGLK